MQHRPPIYEGTTFGDVNEVTFFFCASLRVSLLRENDTPLSLK
ncbi:hypothetical protein SAMN05192544_11037 [Paraburkholderia hospita]|nr:hypothetical protein SAMN05192544_11037 [Paraburkholderia hospita]